MIDCINVVYQYGNSEKEKGKIAVNGVNIHVKKGEFIVVLGRNGSGKSTLAKHINALLIPSDGKVYVDGMDTSDTNNTWNIRHKAGMVFQNPDNQSGDLFTSF